MMLVDVARISMIFSLLCLNLSVGTAADPSFITYGEITSRGSVSDFLSSLAMEACEGSELMKFPSLLRAPLAWLGI